MTVRPLQPADIPAWKRMRKALWPRLTDADNDRECAAILADSEHHAVFVAAPGSQEPQAFADASLRQYADGCETSPVGYLEGWFVQEPIRRGGIGRRLVEAAENWARSKGCTEMGSDAILDNIGSQAAHARLGYDEVERQVCFRKALA